MNFILQSDLNIQELLVLGILALSLRAEIQNQAMELQSLSSEHCVDPVGWGGTHGALVKVSERASVSESCAVCKGAETFL